MDLEYFDQLWSELFHYQFGLCHSFDLSKSKKYEFVTYNKGSRPGIEFTLAQNITHLKFVIILHSKNDFPDALIINGGRTISIPKKSHKSHVIEIQKKISKRVSTQTSPCVMYEYNTCQNIEANKLVLDQFNCQIPFLYFGHHLDHMIPSKTPICSINVTKQAIDLLNNRKSECTRSQTCENRRYTASHSISKEYGEIKKSKVTVLFENPEVE